MTVLLTKRLIRGQRCSKGGRLFVLRRHTTGIPVDGIAAKAFQVGEFEHEGSERGVDGFSYCFFGGGFKAVLESFEMGLDIVNSVGGRLSVFGQGVGSVFYTSNTGVDTLHVLKLFLL